MEKKIYYSIVVLTYNRRDRVKNHIDNFIKNTDKNIEMIVVDNSSDFNIFDISYSDSRINFLKNYKNLGAVGRNSGIEYANGDVIITLDDDVYGLSGADIIEIRNLFNADKDIAAINFKIVEEGTGRIVNWCHPRDYLQYANVEFETNHISEGAVAFRRDSLKKVGLYPESFFISHEGPDLAFRLINNGYKVIYSPMITVTHAYDQRARLSWRRYYYDTRNQLWFVVRNLSIVYGLKRLLIGWGAMLVYSIRDGFFLYWLKAVWDSLKGLPQAWRERTPPTKQARLRCRQIESCKPSLWVMVRRRIKGDRVQI